MVLKWNKSGLRQKMAVCCNFSILSPLYSTFAALNDLDMLLACHSCKFLVLVLFGVLCANAVNAQLDSIPPKNDLAFSINSKALREQRSIWVHLPEDYYSNNSIYPVLYLLDGESHFNYVSSLVDYLSSYDRNRIPEMIVVAILNVDRTRDFTPIHSLIFGGKVDSTLMATTGGGANFLSFIRDELVPYIDSSFRVAPYRILATHSLGGTFGLYTKETNPELFGSTILMSPAIYGGNTEILKRFAPFLRQHQHLAGKMFITIGEENMTTVNALTTQLRALSPKTFTWQFRKYDDENHFSVTYKSMYDALRFIYKDWFIDNYDTARMSYTDIQLHFDKLSKEFGYKMIPPEDFMNNAGYKQLNAGDIDAAIKLFKENITNFPNSSNVYDSMGEAYLKKGEKDLAIENYEKSLALNPHNEEAKEILKKLKGHL